MRARLHHLIDRLGDGIAAMGRAEAGEPAGPPISDAPDVATWRDGIERRLGAVESHAVACGELRNQVNMHEADLRALGAERGM